MGPVTTWLMIREKGARFCYEIDYHSIYLLGARKAAECARADQFARKGGGR